MSPPRHDDEPPVAAGTDPFDLSVPVERERPRGGRFLAASVVALVGVALLAYGLVALLIAERGASLHDALRSRLEAMAGGRAEVIATWLDGLARLGERLSESDLVRLYVHETGLREADEPLSGPLAEQTPYMQRLVDDFAARHGLVGAALVDRDGRPVLTSRGAVPGATDEPELGAAPPWRRALAAAASGRRFTPVRTGPGGALVMDIVLPLATPQPMVGGAGETELAGALVMTVPARDKLAEILRPGPLHQPGERAHLLQADDVGPRRVLLDGAGGFGPLPPGADIEPGAPLTYARLTEVGDVEVLAVGAPVAGLPWTVLQEFEVGPALKPLRDFSLVAALVAVLAALVLALAFAAFWWRQTGAHRGELAVQYRDLAARIHNQRRLLESVTGAIHEMIGLKTPDGRYAYVNRAFAETLRRPADAILGRTDRELFDPALAGRLAEGDRLALEGGVAVTEDDELDLDGRRHHLQTSKVPLRGEGGAVVGVVTVARDVTELVEQRAKHERAIRQAVQALVRAIELRDPYLVGHSERVEGLCTAVARRLDLGARERVTLKLAASLSQIGKIFIPEKILRKPGRHTAEETRIMQGHIGHAVRVLSEIDFELPVTETVHGMYERLDGSGYPRGLKGDEVDLLPRILGAVDVFCARTAPRSYRDRIGRDEALRVLAEHPERYDARVVEALAAVAPESGDEAAAGSGIGVIAAAE